jgi:hypothetical protein
MGVSSTGILFWGVDFGEYPPWVDSETGESSCEDYDDLVWKAFGAKESDSYAVRSETAKSAGVAIVLHCSYEYAMYGLAVSDSELRASRGYPVEIPELIIKPEWEVAFWIAMETFGWQSLGLKPTWILTSVFG